MKALSTSAIIILTLATFTFARTITVDDDGPADFSTIQAAINDANDGDEVVLSEGLYKGDGNRNVNFSGKAITVRSTNPTNPDVVDNTILDCGPKWSALGTIRGFIFNSGEGPDSILSGVTILEGHVLANGSGGGGIYCSGSSPTISYCVIKDSRLNELNYGGSGILCKGSGSPKIIRCKFINNESLGMVGGGAISCRDGSNAVINSCLIYNNSAYYGGGISIRDSNPTIESCLIYNNSVGQRGGGIDFRDSSPNIYNCTIVKNNSDFDGGGIASDSSSSNISNCIIWGNSGDSPVSIRVSGTAPTVTYGDIEYGYSGVGNINMNPSFLNFGGNDFHLSTDSPCINTGDPNCVDDSNNKDIDGQPRIINGRVDMGADELNFTGPVIGLSAWEIEFEANEGEDNPDEQVLAIENIGTGTMDWSIEEDCSWLVVNPENGFCTGSISEVNVIVDISGMTWGRYDCSLRVDSNTAVNSGREVDVILRIFSDYPGGLHVPREYPTIQAAIDDANDGDVVVVGDGIYTGPGNRDIDFLGKAITVRSENGAANCIIDVNASEADPHRAFYLQSYEEPNSIICGFTIRKGHVTDGIRGGGGILCYYSSPTIMNCIFDRNKARWFGGALNYQYDSSPTIKNCTFFGNENELMHAGAIGGCAFEWTEPASLENSVIWGNLPLDSPGIEIQPPPMLGGYSYMNVFYSILQLDGYSYGHHIFVGDPCFFDAANQDYHLHWDSVCIDGGDPNYIPGPNEMDMDGDPRIMDSHIDMGADEFNPNTPVIGLSHSDLVFATKEGGPTPEDQILGIYSITGGTLNWQIDDECGWLQIDPNFGSSTGETDDVNIGVDITGLSYGIYYCDLIVFDANAINSPQIVSITLKILLPSIELSKTEFYFLAYGDGNNPDDQILAIRNSGVDTLNWIIDYDCEWLGVEPNSGSSTGEVDDVNLSVDITGLALGHHGCELTVTDPNAENSPQTAAVHLAMCDVNDCLPCEHSDYVEWLRVDKPPWWCNPRQCRGEADGAQEHIGHTLFWVGWNDLGILVDNWADAQGYPAAYQADFSHSAETIGHTLFRVGFEDLQILLDNWTDNLGSPPDCLDVP